MTSISFLMYSSSGGRSKTAHSASCASSNWPRFASQRGDSGQPQTTMTTTMAKMSWIAIGVRQEACELTYEKP